MDDQHQSLLGFLRCAKELEDDPSLEEVHVYGGRLLSLVGRGPDEEMESQARRGVRVCFDRSNAAIERHRGLGVILFHGACFHGLDDNHEGLKRLFSTILPSHPTLKCVCFCKLGSSLPFRHLMKGLLEARNRTGVGGASNQGSPIKLVMNGSFSSVVEDIVRMLRNNAPVGELLLKDASMAGSSCRLICDALPTNTNLRTLAFEKLPALAVGPSMFRGAFDGSSPLRSFYCSTPATSWEFDAFLEMIRALRTNYTLEELLCCNIPELTVSLPRDAGPWVHRVYQLLRYHNFTLRRMDVFDQHPQIAKLLRQNAGVRAAHVALTRSRYHLRSPAAWPLAMGRISGKPALLYKFLRRGNCDGLGRHLRQRGPYSCSSFSTKRKRCAASLAPSSREPEPAPTQPSCKTGRRPSTAGLPRRASRAACQDQRDAPGAARPDKS